MISQGGNESRALLSLLERCEEVGELRVSESSSIYSSVLASQVPGRAESASFKWLDAVDATRGPHRPTCAAPSLAISIRPPHSALKPQTYSSNFPLAPNTRQKPDRPELTFKAPALTCSVKFCTS